MIDLDLLKYKENIRSKKEGDYTRIFDPIRKSWYIATPEEYVRQLLIQYLSLEKEIPFPLMSVEKGIAVLKRNKRFDLLVYNQEGNPMILIECKAPNISLDQSVFDQISIYNIEIQVPYLMITNGRSTLMCEVNLGNKTFRFLDSIPDLDTINSKEKNTFKP